MGDYARLDRIKEVVGQVLKRAQDPRTWPALTLALREAWGELDTNLTLEELLAHLPAVRGLKLALATLPTREGPGTFLYVDEEARGRFLSAFFGVAAPSSPPRVAVRLRGEPELMAWARLLLAREGIRPRKRLPRWLGAPSTPKTPRPEPTSPTSSTCPSSLPTGPWRAWWWSSGGTCYNELRW